MKKIVRKIKKILAEIDHIGAKEEILREDLAEAIDELEVLTGDGGGGF